MHVCAKITKRNFINKVVFSFAKLSHLFKVSGMPTEE